MAKYDTPTLVVRKTVIVRTLMTRPLTFRRREDLRDELGRIRTILEARRALTSKEGYR